MDEKCWIVVQIRKDSAWVFYGEGKSCLNDVPQSWFMKYKFKDAPSFVINKLVDHYGNIDFVNKAIETYWK